MKIKVFQIRPELDKARVKFLDMVGLKHITGNENPDPSIYSVVFDGDVPVDSNVGVFAALEKIYMLFNVSQMPQDYRGHSLSVSDIVELEGKTYFCDTFGFVEVKWLN